ncbi:MAG: S9 family peptidase, partial [Bifidobacteriaceae bacterium]|nr:S9 family peptidase [Bifidobacteriaceae bacterium]
MFDYPRAPKRPAERTFHSDTFVDNYEWLRDKDSQETRDYIDAENAYTERRLAPLKGLRSTLFDEMKSRIQETDMSVPTRMDGYWYFGRTVEGKQYGLQCRIPVAEADDWTPPSVDAASEPGSLPGEEIYFDANRESAGHDFFRLGALDLSKDGSIMLYGTDVHGDERYDLRLRAIGTGTAGSAAANFGVKPGDDFDEVIEQVGGGACLSPDGHWVFYTKVDEAWRPYA